MESGMKSLAVAVSEMPYLRYFEAVIARRLYWRSPFEISLS